MTSRRDLAASLYAQGYGYKAIARLLCMSRGTVQVWRRRHCWKRATASPPQEATVSPPVGEWMQSLLHETAHFLVSGVPACSNGPNGAKITPGMQWFKHDGCLRKCLRCMRHENDSTEARA